jgi:hypothetical protein
MPNVRSQPAPTPWHRASAIRALLIVKDDLALDEHLLRARERGVVVDEVEPTDPGDLRRGWKVHRPT